MQRYEFYSDSKVIILKKIGTYCFLYGLYENPEYNPYPFSKTKIIMASFKLKFRPSTLPEQEGTLYFQVIHRRTVRMIHTGFHIRQDEWNDTTSSIRIAGTPERQNFLRLTASKIKWYTNQLTAIITEMETKRVEYGTEDIVSAYKQLPTCPTWFGFILDMADRKAKVGRPGTAKTYRDALSSFARFRQGTDIALDELNAETMTLYEAWMKSRGLKRNSSSCYLRTLRTLYRKAVEMGLTTDKGIFRHVFTGFAKTSKRAIPLEAIRTIRLLRLPAGSPLIFARDMFILSIYLQGISFVDLAYLRKSDIRNGVLQYDRKKTRQSLNIGWEPSMQAIVETYAHLTTESPYLLPIITHADGTERRQYEKAEHNINRNLKKIGRIVGLRIPLTTYVARHTWATTMRDMGYDLSIVSTGLGHDSLKTTQIYLSSIDTTVVMEANKKMIDKILK